MRLNNGAVLASLGMMAAAGTLGKVFGWVEIVFWTIFLCLLAWTMVRGKKR